MRVRERLIVGMRGSYSGVLMTGLVTSLAGMPLLNPVSLVAGVVLGRKAYKDDAENRKQRRQGEANNIVRRHLDEVVFQAGKVLKDRLRTVQRTLRDLISETVTELSATYGEANRAAQPDPPREVLRGEAALVDRERDVDQLAEPLHRERVGARYRLLDAMDLAEVRRTVEELLEGARAVGLVGVQPERFRAGHLGDCADRGGVRVQVAADLDLVRRIVRRL